ncbi:MAG: gamma-glutamyl-gamma-aminobutyrate hydrolase family protein [Verrucomicrobia bacterium]|nr:gamma-glutamyl-gamma-aminobutyrate hydrolase family protein [Verrucomicrobiota bacterium]
MDAARPRILIAPSTERAPAASGGLKNVLSESYALAIRAGGGLPWIAPCLPEQEFVKDVMGMADGLLLTGGDDVGPELYDPGMSEGLRSTIRMDGPERDGFELLLVKEAFARGIPVFAICRGMQMLNVALGGTLIADINMTVPNALEHRRSDAKDQLVHDVEVASGTLLSGIHEGERMLGVNSTHHQAVGRLAKVFRPNAVSRDGIVEGFELAEPEQCRLPYVMAVQFHPERLWARFQTHLNLFTCFVSACRRNRQ